MNNEIEERRKVVLGITGSIAAYKSAELARLLVTNGYQVRCIMSDSAREFITPLTLQSVTGNPVITTYWENVEGAGIEHIEIADWADGIVIAPATADCIAKLAAGFADSPLLGTVLASKAPLLIAPAMNVNMLTHPQTQANLAVLRDRGVSIVPPEEGALACGWNGAGRLADLHRIVMHIRRLVSTQDYAGKKILVTAGPTREPLDPVRFISNRSSGKMGVALAREAYRRGAEVTLVHGPLSTGVPTDIRTVSVLTAEEMRQGVIDAVYGEGDYDAVIMSAAVSDFRPVEVAAHKVKKSSGTPQVELTKNPDILAEVGLRKSEKPGMKVVGFAVETGEMAELLEELRRKLETKNVDLMVGNFAQEAFDLDTNKVWLINRYNKQEEVTTASKARVANKILDAVLKL